MKKLLTIGWCLLRFPKVAVILIITWWMLHDLPPTSRGGFWFYCWPVYVIGIVFYVWLCWDFLREDDYE